MKSDLVSGSFVIFVFRFFFGSNTWKQLPTSRKLTEVCKWKTHICFAVSCSLSNVIPIRLCFSSHRSLFDFWGALFAEKRIFCLAKKVDTARMSVLPRHANYVILKETHGCRNSNKVAMEWNSYFSRLCQLFGFSTKNA